MKTLCWLLSGHPSIDDCKTIIDAYVKGGCEGIEWSIPFANPYIGQEYRFKNESEAYKNCPDMEKHLELIAATKIKYPNVDITPGFYKETMLDIGTNNVINFCIANNIDNIITVGRYDQEIIDELNRSGIKNTVEVSYYLTEEELNAAKKGSGYIYMQALPYPAEIEAGYSTERLGECIKILRNTGIDRPIYGFMNIREPEDIKIIKNAGADGFILGSLLLEHYNNMEVLSEIINAFKEAGE